MEDKSKEKSLKVEELKKKYGKLYEIKTEIEPRGEYETVAMLFYFKKPKTSSFNRYIRDMSKDSIRAMNNFVRDNIIEEQLEEIESQLEKYPALGLGVGEKLLSMLGLPKTTNFKLL
ncbi:MAG: hypothetical protein COA82_06620 [Alkaliphilus sp.]|nr:MAG: hypothetical protein COA82_06620 [Alkaliphilus sp.]